MLSFRCIFTYGVVFCTATLIGYDSGYLNGVLASKDFTRRYGRTNASGEYYLTSETRSLFSSIFAVGTILGCTVCSFLPDKFGRKGGFLLAGTLYTIGVVLQVISSVPAVFIIGRVLLGMALGIISIVTPTYLVESSSASSRGKLMALYTQFLTCGNVIACGISMGTANNSGSSSWRVTVAFQLVLAMMVFLGGIVAPESPLILAKLEKGDAARKSMSILRNLDPESVETEIAIQEIYDMLATQTSFGKQHFAECFKGTNLRRTLLGTTMGFMNIATGVTFWFSYGTTFFLAAGVHNSYLVSLILALVNAIFTAPSVYLIERVGRRSCLLVGGFIMGVAQLVTAVLHSVSPGSTASSNCLVAGSVIFIAAYACSWGSIGWTTMAEPYAAHLAVLQTTMSMYVYWVSTWAIGFVVPYLVDADSGNLGINIAYLWTAMVVISLVWAYFCVPELAGLSKSEVDMLFEQRVPAWRSVAWGKQLRVIASTEVEDHASLNIVVEQAEDKKSEKERIIT